MVKRVSPAVVWAESAPLALGWVILSVTDIMEELRLISIRRNSKKKVFANPLLTVQ